MKNYIELALQNTFCYRVKFTKKQMEQKSMQMFYKNQLFMISISEMNTMTVITPYLSPCMYFRHHFLQRYKYNKRYGNYVLECSGHNNDNNNAITFDIIDEVPIDFLMITNLFMKHWGTCDNIETIEITKEQDQQKISEYLSKYNFKNESDDTLSDVCKKAKKDYYGRSGKLVVQNSEWATADMGLNRLTKNDYFSELTKMTIANINQKLTQFEKLKREIFSDEIEGVAKLQGGLDLSSINNSFGFAFLNDWNEYNIIRCTDSLFMKNERQRRFGRIGAFTDMIYKPQQTFREYNLNECDIQSIVVFDEFLALENVQTTLQIDDDGRRENMFQGHSNYKAPKTIWNTLFGL